MKKKGLLSIAMYFFLLSLLYISWTTAYRAAIHESSAPSLEIQLTSTSSFPLENYFLFLFLPRTTVHSTVIESSFSCATYFSSFSRFNTILLFAHQRQEFWNSQTVSNKVNSLKIYRHRSWPKLVDVFIVRPFLLKNT